MKTRVSLLALLSLFGGIVTASAQGTAFTYQGQLTDGGNPANGLYDFRFSVMESPELGVPLDLRTTNGVPVNNGLFTVTLDFGAELFDGSRRWLEIEVKSNNAVGPYTLLSPRQELTAAPYAILAGSISGALPGAGLSGTYSSPVTLDNAANLFSGSFTGNGGELTNVNAGRLEGMSAASFWRVSGNADTAPGTHFLGTIDNQALDVRVNNARALRLEPTVGPPNVIGGAEDNMVVEGIIAATISGGTANAVGASFGTVSGGEHNTASFPWATIGGGDWNMASAFDATVGGGFTNLAVSSYATVGGGIGNVASGGSATVGGGAYNRAAMAYSTIGGGQGNTASNLYATISGGFGNTVKGSASTIGGGFTNGIELGSANSVIGGGRENHIADYVDDATIAGGRGNSIGVDSDVSAIGGGWLNTIAEASLNATISGGQWNDIGTNSYFTAIGGGYDNNIAGNSESATIGGGSQNTIQDYATNATIGGGLSNTASARYATVAGGRDNVAGGVGAFVGGGGLEWKYGGAAPNQALGMLSAVVGGSGNLAEQAWCFVGGGYLNWADSTYATVCGGVSNIASSYATTVSGGTHNVATRSEATVGGGSSNSATNGCATVPGGYKNVAGGHYSLAAGRRAKALHDGAFVWADARDLDYFSTTTNEFSIRAEGGVRIDSRLGIKLNDIDRPLITRGWFPFTSGAYEGVGRFGLFMEPWKLTAGLPTHGATEFQIVSYNEDSTINTVLMSVNQSGVVTADTFNPTSDRAAKEHFEPVDPLVILEQVASLAITRWNFKRDAGTRHLGPVAQDFHAAFGLGTDDKHIATVDADGVALAAIQGLNQIVKEKEARITDLEKTVGELKAIVNALNRKLNGGGQ